MKGLLKQSAALMLLATMTLLSACGGASPSQASSSSSDLPQSTSSEAPSTPSESAVPIPEEKPAPRMIAEEAFTHLSSFKNGYAFAVKGDEWGYLGLDGSFTASITPTQEGVAVYGGFIDATVLEKNPNPFPVSEEGLYPFLKDGQWGIRKMGAQSDLIPAELDYPTLFKNQRAVICRTITTGGSSTSGNVTVDAAGETKKISVIDTDGKEVFAPVKVAQPHYANGLLTVALEDTPQGKLDVVDVNGKRVMEIQQFGMGGMPSMFGETPYDKENLNLLNATDGQPITYARSGKSGYTFVAPSGKELFSTGPEVNNSQNFSYDRVFMRDSSSNLWAMFDNTGKPLTEYLYDNLFYFRNPKFTLVREPADNKYYLIDINGKRIGDFAFDSVYSIPQADFVGVGVGTDVKKVGALDGQGNIIVPLEYDGITECYNGFYWVEKDKVWTLKSLEGETPEFQTATEVLSLGADSFAIKGEAGYQVMTVGAVK